MSVYASQRGSVFGKLLLMLAVGAAVAGFLAIEAKRYGELRRLQDKTNVLAEDVARAQTQAEAALAAIITPQTLNTARASVYLIVVNGSARGTAFVIDQENGTLVTAAHTAGSLPLDDETATVELLNRESDRRFTVTSRQLHAGFGTFRELVEEHQPIRRNSTIYAPNAAALRDLAFDAALLSVDPIDPETGLNVLGPALPIADEQDLLALDAGAPIAVIGYPFDTLDDGFAPDAATPRVERGVIAAMTPPLDTAQEVRDREVANLIIHRLSTAGGNSGSPILNHHGEVIGIHTHGVVSPSSNADGAAQRADVIFDLLSAEREADRLTNVFLPAWERTLGFWARAEDALPWSFYMEYARPGEEPAPLVRDLENYTPLPFERRIERLTFEPETEKRRIEAARLGNDQSTAAAPSGSSFTIDDKGEFAEIWRTVDRSKENVLFAFDYSLRSRRGYCQVAAYWRKAGDTKLRVLQMRASFELHLPKAGAFTEDYQIILRRRANCDPISSEFLFGEITWSSDKPVAQTVAYQTGTGDHHTQAGNIAAPLNGLRVRMANFIQCDLPRRNTPEACREPVFIEIEHTTHVPARVENPDESEREKIQN